MLYEQLHGGLYYLLPFIHDAKIGIGMNIPKYILIFTCIRRELVGGDTNKGGKVLMVLTTFHRYGLFFVVDGNEGEGACDGFVAFEAVHFFYVYFYKHFEAGVAHVGDAAYELDDGTCGDGLFEIYFVGWDCDHALAGETGGGDKGYFVHEVHSSAAEQGVVVIGSIGEYRFEDARFGIVYSFFSSHD